MGQGGEGEAAVWVDGGKRVGEGDEGRERGERVDERVGGGEGLGEDVVRLLDTSDLRRQSSVLDYAPSS